METGWIHAAASTEERLVHQFETFRRTGGVPTEPLVTIQRRGLISLNSAAYRALGSPVAVELLYNAERSTIALRAVDPHASHSHIVRSTSRSGAGPYVISATAFTRFYDIDTSTASRWVARMQDGLLCLDLTSRPVPISARPAITFEPARATEGAATADHSG